MADEKHPRMTNETLVIQRYPRLPNGNRRPKRKRDTLSIDFGDDIWGTKARLVEVSRETGRTMSSIIRVALRKHLGMNKRK